MVCVLLTGHRAAGYDGTRQLRVEKKNGANSVPSFPAQLLSFQGKRMASSSLCSRELVVKSEIHTVLLCAWRGDVSGRCVEEV